MLYKWLKKQTVSTVDNTIAYRMRKKRSDKFYKYFYNDIYDKNQKRRITILDLGGTEQFWYAANPQIIELSDITMINIKKIKCLHETEYFHSIVGDATNLSQYPDKSIDLVFSNSVIEHVGSFESQKKMADEMLRVGKHIYIQTPNKMFPMEPHFVIPFFQFLSRGKQAKILMKKEKISFEKALNEASSINLIDKKTLEVLFPNQKIKKERFLGLTKSFEIYF